MSKALFLISLCLCLGSNSILAYSQKPTSRIYIIPGQGSDARLFHKIKMENHEFIELNYIVPNRNETMESYAARMTKQIDLDQPFSLIGVSLGGMLAIEISKITNPEKVVLIASAKNRKELPALYRVFKYVPLHRILGGKFLKYWTKILQPIFEPMPKEDQELWRSMINLKDPKFMKRALRCIVEWEETESSTQVIHIHGSRDKTLPLRYIENAIIIEGGTHIIALTHAAELTSILLNVFD